MGRRIEVELTSTREDGSWTWRAAGAKQPKGEVLGSLLYDDAKVGDVVKVEAEFHLDGIEVTEVFAPKRKKERTDLLEMKVRELRDDELVTTQRVKREDRRGDRRGGRGNRNRDDRGGSGGGGGGGGRRDRRPPQQEADRRPKPKRLRPKRTHRDELLQSVSEEHRPIVEQVIKDGMPGVRAAIEKQNAENKEAGRPEIDGAPILEIAEKNLNKARLAEWRDRADAALADAAELDIRDLRSVVVAGDDLARDDESRSTVESIRAVLNERLESDHALWLADLESAVADGRVVRGLRLSSRPVKAGAPLPTEIASKLSQQAAEALAPDIGQERWATVLDALAFSPVRGAVTPAGVPSQPSEELLAEVRRLSDRIPTIAGLFGIDPAAVPKSAKRRRSPRRDRNTKGGGGKQGGQGGENRQRKDRPAPGAEPKKDRPVPGAEPKAEAPADESKDDSQVVEPTTDTAAPTEEPKDDSQVAEPTTDSPAPAAEEASTEQAAPAETPAEDTAPAAEEAPAEDAAPAEEPAPAAEEAPAEDAAPAAEEAPAEDAAPAEEPAPAAEEAPAEDAAPAAEEAPAEEAAPVAEEAPAVEAEASAGQA